MSQRVLTPNEVKPLLEALGSDYQKGNIRLREGEYQYVLAKTIASTQLELMFPDVKDIIRKLYGEEKTKDIQFVRKIQTILKKMEKSDVVKILPKRKPWELQRYMLKSFKFQDSDNNLIVFATDDQKKQSENLLQSALHEQEAFKVARNSTIAKISALALAIFASYVMTVLALIQSVTSPLIFIPAFSIAVVCSIALGKKLSQH